MAYGDGITIKEMIEEIQGRQYVLPSIQREFVWNMTQIEKLFDSLMRDYPISTFLFWKIDKEYINKFKFYDFLRFYHEKDKRHNDKLNLLGKEAGIMAILDGQQRMTSLYLGLKGSYSKKKKGGWANNPDAYIKRNLYLNLMPKPTEENSHENAEEHAEEANYDGVENDDIEMEYEFRFLTDEEAISNEGQFWFRCEKILDFKDTAKAMGYLDGIGLTDREKYSQETIDFSRNTIADFFEIVHRKKIINYYLEKSKELDKVLQIFIRTNSAGTVLSHSDLLLSMVTSNWGKIDARKVINDFVDSINQTGDGFNFNKDVVLKACLVFCSDDVKFKVDNFTQHKMAQIEQAWDKISEAIRTAVNLVNSLGYKDASLTAKNAIIPIAYYLYRNDINGKNLFSGSHYNSIRDIKEWLARVLLSGFFGGTADSIYPKIREIIDNNEGEFPLQNIIDYYKDKPKSISFTEGQVKNLLELRYGDKRAYSLLSLLYDGVSVNGMRVYHQDHIHPQEFFKFKKAGVFAKGGSLEGQYDEFFERKDKISNLQLLPDNINIGKKAKSFKIWLDESLPDKNHREKFLSESYIGIDQSLEFEDFLDFYEERGKRIKAKLMQVLGVETDSTESEAA